MDDLKGFLPKPRPEKITLKGNYICLKTMDWQKHGSSLAGQIIGADNQGLWTYIPFGLPSSAAELRAL